MTVGAGGTGGNNKTSGGVTGETNPRYPVDPIKPPIDPVKPVNPPDIKPKPLPPLSNGGDNNTNLVRLKLNLGEKQNSKLFLGRNPY